jgi:hypothetical protein
VVVVDANLNAMLNTWPPLCIKNLLDTAQGAKSYYCCCS